MKWLISLVLVATLAAPVSASFMRHQAEYNFDGDFVIKKHFGGQFERVSTKIEGTGEAEFKETFEVYDGVCIKQVEISWYDLF